MGSFTLSKAALAQHCLYPFRKDVEVPDDTSANEARDAGTSCHGAASRMINTGCRVEIPDAPDSPTWRLMAAWIQEYYQPTWVAEEAIAWDPLQDSARVLGIDIGREYEEHGAKPHEVCGTCDVVDVGVGRVSVYEFGTGWNVSHKLDQLRLQCLVAARAHGVDSVSGHLVQFREDGVFRWDPIVLDEFDLSVIAGELADKIAQLPTAEPTVSEACVDLFCDARTVCPVTQEAQAALVPVDATMRKFSKVIEDPDHARWMLDRIRLVKSACKEISKAIDEYVPEGGLELPDGKYLYEAAREMPRFDAHKAMALCKQLGATEAQIASLTRPVVEGAGIRVGSKKAAEAAAAKRRPRHADRK